MVDFMRAVIVSEQPGAVLGHASCLRCAAEDVEEERRIEQPGVGGGGGGGSGGVDRRLHGRKESV